MNPEATVYIVDDDADVRASLRWLMESVHLKTECYGSADEFLKAFRHDRPCCVLLDVRMPGLSGLDLQSKLAADGVRVPIIIITGHADVPMAVRAMKHRAFDFIEKPFNDQVLLDRVNQAVKADQARFASESEAETIRNCMATLSPRELEVMSRVVSGESNKAIAAMLGLSPKTVEVHRASVMRKLGVRSLAALVRMQSSVGVCTGQYLTT